MIGPWLHTGPDAGPPGPTIHINHEMIRWWDYWLKGMDNGVTSEPPISIYVQKYDRPRANRASTSGFWRFETEWPIKRSHDRTFFLGESGLLSEKPNGAQETGVDTYEYEPEVGLSGGLFSSVLPHVLPTDQRLDEALSLVYTGEKLRHDLEVTGAGRAVVYVSSSASVASFVVRLSDVPPSGASALVCKGVLNGTRRKSFEKPEPFVPGEVYELHIPLETTSWVFEKGHRVRVSISSSDWPNMWPTPERATNRLHRGGSLQSRVILPVVSAKKTSSSSHWATVTPTYLPPVPPYQPATVTPGADDFKMVVEPYKNEVTIRARPGRALKIGLKDIGADVMIRGIGEAGLSLENPASAHVKGSHRARMKRKDSVIDVTGSNLLVSTAEEFHLLATVEISIDGSPFFSKSWSKSFRRELM